MPRIKVEFTGGLETLFFNKRNLDIALPATGSSGTTYTIGDLITLIATEHVQQEKKGLFVLDGTVRPGILVLVNDADWELEGEAAYELQEGDTIVFVSTLHGG